MNHKYALAGVATLLALSACDSDVKQSLGIKKKGPDAFTVVAHPPLEMPPEFALRPPRPGAPRPQEESQEDRAARLILEPEQSAAAVEGVSASALPAATAPSATDSLLLRRAGAENANPAIRDTLNAETQQVEEKKNDKNFIQKMLPDHEAKGEIINPVEESQRMGKPVPGAEADSEKDAE